MIQTAALAASKGMREYLRWALPGVKVGGRTQISKSLRV